MNAKKLKKRIVCEEFNRLIPKITKTIKRLKKFNEFNEKHNQIKKMIIEGDNSEELKKEYEKLGKILFYIQDLVEVENNWYVEILEAIDTRFLDSNIFDSLYIDEYLYILKLGYLNSHKMFILNMIKNRENYKKIAHLIDFGSRKDFIECLSK